MYLSIYFALLPACGAGGEAGRRGNAPQAVPALRGAGSAAEGEVRDG